jgi:hypothetical protein
VWLNIINQVQPHAHRRAQFFKGTEGKRVERIDVGHITASRHERHAEEQMDEQDANRDARRKAVVDKAVEILLEVVEGIEKGEKCQV